MAMQPVGPLPASTYWRRRVVLLLVVLVLLLLGLKACGGDDSPRSLATTTASPTPRGTTSAAPTPTTAVTASPTAAAVAACSDAALQVTVQSDASTYKAGGSPRFTLSVTNTGTRPCRRALGPDAVELRVFSGEDRIWSSDDCNKGTGQGVLELAPHEARQLTVQWPGKRTRPKCVLGDVAKPGTYRVSARVGAVVRQGSVFYLT